MKVLVLAGGNSNERDISLKSGEAVARALKASGLDVKVVDPVNKLDSYLGDLKAVDVVFPALHGEGGEDGVLQEFLEQNNIKYVGSKVHASKLCFDKYDYYQFMIKHKVLMPETLKVNLEEYLNSKLREKSHVLKPIGGGSSIDTFIVRDPFASDNKLIKEAFNRHGEMILQALIEGIELTVPFLLGKSLPVIEIIPPENQEFDYDNKYNGATKEICPPKNIPKDVQQEARDLAGKIHILCGCQDMSRTDFMLDKNNQLFVLETNTIPGLTDQSLLPKAAKQTGIDMPTMCKRLVESAYSS